MLSLCRCILRELQGSSSVYLCIGISVDVRPAKTTSLVDFSLADFDATLRITIVMYKYSYIEIYRAVNMRII